MVIFTNVETSPTYYGTGYQDYLWVTYRDVNGILENCLDPSEMTYWLGKLKEFALLQAPAGKVLTNYNVRGDADCNVTEEFHEANFSYSIWHSY
jgi:hypothetical protein